MHLIMRKNRKIQRLSARENVAFKHKKSPFEKGLYDIIFVAYFLAAAAGAAAAAFGAAALVAAAFGVAASSCFN